MVAAFDNLLPNTEGELREKIATGSAQRAKTSFPCSPALTPDCVGALQFLAPGEGPRNQDMDFREISAEDVADLKNLAVAPLA